MSDEHIEEAARDYLRRATDTLELARAEQDLRQVAVYVASAYADANAASALADAVPLPPERRDVQYEASELRERSRDALKEIMRVARFAPSAAGPPMLEVLPGGRVDNPVASLKASLMPPRSRSS